MLPDLRISIDCDPGFRRPAQYALATLALIAGRRARFVAREPDVHYGPARQGSPIWLPASPEASSLLRRTRVRPDARNVEISGTRILGLFPCSDADTAVPTDIVAAAFFFLSLHEEWTAEQRDQFGRFRAADSLLGTRGEVDRPVVAEYAQLLDCLLEGASHPRPQGRFEGFPSAAVMTHDIDYLSKWTPGLLFRELIKNFLFNRRHVASTERFVRLREYFSFLRRGNDPYVASIARMLAVQKEKGIVGSWLFKAGGSDKRDVTYSLSSARARETLALLRVEGHDIGLHPSFNAHTDAGMLAHEAARLRRAAGGELRSVRQHYLRFDYPRTWRHQVEERFFVDSTLGFAEQEGFRNGACHPFIPWDLERSEPLPIWQLPLTVMDGTLAHYRGLDPETSKRRIEQLLDTVASHRGVAVLLYQKTSYDAQDFPGWGGVFEAAAERISDGRFFTGSLPQTVDAWLSSAGYVETGDFIQVINSEPVP